MRVKLYCQHCNHAGHAHHATAHNPNQLQCPNCKTTGSWRRDTELNRTIINGHPVQTITIPTKTREQE